MSLFPSYTTKWAIKKVDIYIFEFKTQEREWKIQIQTNYSTYFRSLKYHRNASISKALALGSLYLVSYVLSVFDFKLNYVYYSTIANNFLSRRAAWWQAFLGADKSESRIIIWNIDSCISIFTIESYNLISKLKVLNLKG